MPNADLSRRRLLAALALCPLGAAGAPGWAQDAADAAGLVSPNVCLLTPETTAGPFYLDPRLVREDIREGRPGVPLEVVLQVVDPDCRPIAGARVDAWQCDASGNYSGFAGQGSDRALDTRGETFLRGIQATGADGVARFLTIWPGWYRGRTPHVHYRVALDDRQVLTSQLFFPDGTSEAIYREAEPYAARAAAQDMDNRRDRIALRAGDGAVARVSRGRGRFRAALVVGVRA